MDEIVRRHIISPYEREHIESANEKTANRANLSAAFLHKLSISEIINSEMD